MKYRPDDDRRPTLAKLEWLFMPQSEIRMVDVLDDEKSRCLTQGCGRK
jgi:hypothetical protein